MPGFLVIVEPTTFEYGSGNSLTGQIWVEVNGQEFPEVRWSDFPLVLLGRWCQAVAEALRALDEERDLRFMDGPFCIGLSAQSNGTIRVTLYARGERVGADTCQAEEVRAQVLNAASALLRYCEQNGVDGTDVRSLQLGAADLKGRGEEPDPRSSDPGT